MLNVANVPLHHHQNSTHQSSNLDVGGVDLHHHLHLNHNRNNKSSSSLSQKASYTTSASSSPLVLRVSKTAPNSKSSSSTSLASTSTNNTQQTQTPGTPSRIPVYIQNRNGSQQQQQGRSRLNSLSDTLKHYHQLHHQLLQQQHHLQHQQPLNQSTKHSLSAHQLSDLPEDIKLMHIVHCHCSHNLNSASMPRSVFFWFYFQTRSNLFITFQIQDSRLYRHWPSKRRQLLFGALLFLDARHLDAQRSQAVQCLVIEWAAEQGEHRHCRHHHHHRQQQQLHSKQCCLSLRGVPAPL